MNNKKNKGRFFNIKSLQIIGVMFVLLMAGILIWQGNTNNYQATPALVAKVYFEGEYRIEDGKWQKIEEGKHIPSTQGDVTLRGNFHILAPNGEYIGIYKDELPIAFYTDHIHLTFYENGVEPYAIDAENPLFKDSGCGVNWTAHTFVGQSDGPIEIVVHNPHTYGNDTAIDDMLSNVGIWTGIEFEKSVLDSGKVQRNIGVLFIIVAFMFLGSALFSTLIHIKNSRILWVFGSVVIFAGLYLIYSIDSIAFWSELVISNTTILGCSMIFYMLFLLFTIVHFLKETKTLGKWIVAILCVVNAIVLIVPIVSEVFFYDMLPHWVIAQMIANTALFGCLLKEIHVSKGKEKWIYVGSIALLFAYAIDVIMTYFGIWKGGFVSKYIFALFFIVVLIAVLRIIPRSINAIAIAKELETEKIKLNAQLSESRVATMMSQIRPHFIYNTLGSIEQLCVLDPSKAKELVHNFAKYLRGNFRELDNVKPILMSQEMEHVHHYVSIENVRFPDMMFTFEMNSNDFYIPALSVQPIVENAIKHGLMKLQKGGTIRVVSYETAQHYCVLVEDDGMGFDTNELLDERKHVGIRNIRERLKAMVNGTLEIESVIGKGTKVHIFIPKEEKK